METLAVTVNGIGSASRAVRTLLSEGVVNMASENENSCCLDALVPCDEGIAEGKERLRRELKALRGALSPEQRAAEGADAIFGRYINALKKVPPFCGIDHIYANGKVVLSYKNGWPGDYRFAILVREDSLMLADASRCKTPIWGGCGMQMTI
jgi:hypothetical protein